MSTIEELNAEQEAKRAEIARAKEAELLKRQREREAMDKMTEMQADAAFGPPGNLHAEAERVLGKSPRSMAYDEEEALRHDAARRESEVAAAVGRNKAANAHRMPQTPPERMPKLAEAQRLRVELGGFASLPADVRTHPTVREKLWPRVKKYAELRCELAMEATCDALVAELQLSRDELRELVYGGAPTSTSDTKPVDASRDAGEPGVVADYTPPRGVAHLGRAPFVIGGGTATSDSRLAHLEQQVATLNAHALEVRRRLGNLEHWGEDIEKRMPEHAPTKPFPKFDTAPLDGEAEG